MITPVDISTLRPGDKFSFSSYYSPICRLVEFERGYVQDLDGYDVPGYYLRWTNDKGESLCAWDTGFTEFVYPHP